MPSSPVAAPVRVSLRLNIAANYLGQLYAGLVAIVMIPVYLRWLSPEAYGLVAFFALLQAWAQLLDLGLSASVARQAARFAGRELDTDSFRSLLRAFEWIFWSLGLMLALALASTAGPISASWLQVERLPHADVQNAIQLMAVAVGLRWVGTLYRSVLSGAERQVWLNAFTTVVMTLRFVVVVPVVLATGGTIVDFFAFQVAVAVVELAGLWWTAYRLAPVRAAVRLSGGWPLLRQSLRFSAWAGVAALVWVFVSQADKLVISTLVPLADYGFFTAAASVASAVTILGLAVSQALLPRLTQLAAPADRAPLFALYRGMTRWTVAVGVPMALTLAMCAEPLLWMWTGDGAFARTYAPVLALYAIGNAFMLLNLFPYCLQYALGNLRLHVLGNLLLGVVMMPLLLYAVARQGPVGAGWLWAGANAAFFLCWTPLVHRNFAPGLHARWLLRDVALVAVPPCGVAALVAVTGVAASGSRPEAFVRAGAVFAVLLLASLCVIRATRAARSGAGGEQAAPTEAVQRPQAR